MNLFHERQRPEGCNGNAPAGSLAKIAVVVQLTSCSRSELTFFAYDEAYAPANGYGLDIDLHGSLAGILTVASKHKDKAKRAEIIQQVVSVAEGCDRYDLDMQETVVAGARSPLEDCIFGKMVAGARNHLTQSGQAVVFAGTRISQRFDCLERSMGHRVNASKVVRRLARA